MSGPQDLISGVPPRTQSGALGNLFICYVANITQKRGKRTVFSPKNLTCPLEVSV